MTGDSGRARRRVRPLPAAARTRGSVAIGAIQAGHRRSADIATLRLRATARSIYVSGPEVSGDIAHALAANWRDIQRIRADSRARA